MPFAVVRLGYAGTDKQIYLGARESDNEVEYFRAFIKLASSFEHPKENKKSQTDEEKFS